LFGAGTARPDTPVGVPPPPPARCSYRLEAALEPSGALSQCAEAVAQSRAVAVSLCIRTMASAPPRASPLGHEHVTLLAASVAGCHWSFAHVREFVRQPPRRLLHKAASTSFRCSPRQRAARTPRARPLNKGGTALSDALCIRLLGLFTTAWVYATASAHSTSAGQPMIGRYEDPRLAQIENPHGCLRSPAAPWRSRPGHG
jgi:hypothetical protein